MKLLDSGERFCQTPPNVKGLDIDLLDLGDSGCHMDDVSREGAVPGVGGRRGGEEVGSVRLQQDPVQARLLHDSAGPSTPR